MSDTILVINAGSSSIKFYLYDIDGKEELAPRLGGQLEGIGTTHPRLRVRDAAGQTLVERDIAPSHAPDVPNGQEVVGTWLSGHLGGAPLAVGHRVVHGGPELSEPVLIDDDILARLDATPAGAAAPAQQPGAHPRDPRAPPLDSPGRLLRHRLPSQPFRGGRPLRPARLAVPAGRAALRLPWPVLRVHRPAPAARAARGRDGQDRRRPPARACRPAPSTRAGAWTAPWASRRSRACPWARGRAGWTPAWCCG